MKISHLPLLGLALGSLFACASCDAPATEIVDQQSSTPAETEPVMKPTMEAVQLGSMRKLHKFGDVYLGSQPSEADLALFKERGVMSVINMRKAQEMSFDQAAVAEELGLTYNHLGWNGPDELTDALFDNYREIMNNVQQPLLLHCASCNRVGAIWIVWRVLDQGAGLEEAVAEAKMSGMRTPGYETKARDYVVRMTNK